MNPIILFAIYRRPHPPDLPRCPIIFFPPRDPTGPLVQFFDLYGQPCLEVNHVYVSLPNYMYPPPGYELIAGHRPPSSSDEWMAAQPRGVTFSQSVRPLPVAETPNPAPAREEDLSATSTTVCQQTQKSAENGEQKTPAPSDSGAKVQPSSEHRQTQPLTVDVGSAEAELMRYIITKGADGYYAQPPKAGYPRQATNFIIDLKEVRHRVLPGRKDERTIRFDVRFSPTNVTSLEISYRKLNRILAEVLAEVGEAILLRGNFGAFEAELQNLLREELAACPHRFVFQRSGWIERGKKGFTYVEDGALPPDKSLVYETGFSFLRGLQPRPPHQLAAEAWQLLHLGAEPAAGVVPFLFAHLGLMHDLFERAGHRPNFLLFMEGTTGSLKTAVASLLFNFSGRPEENIPASFRDTSASMEIGFDRYRDRVFLVDDFCPAADSTSQREMSKSLEHLIRFFGDGKSRSRATPKMDSTVEMKPSGLVAITGEDVAGSHSSLLRCLFVTIHKRTYDRDLLREFQEDPSRWTEYLALFVSELAPHANEVIQTIRTKFLSLRKFGQSFLKENRLADTYAFLALTTEIILSVMGRFLPNEAESYRQVIYPALQEACLASGAKAAEENPARIFARTVLDLQARNLFPLGSVQEYVVAPQNFVGVADDNQWLLHSKTVFRLVCTSYATAGKKFPLSAPALWRSLAAAGVLTPSTVNAKDGPKTEFGTKVKFGKRPRLLVIDPVRLRELAESQE